MNEIAYTKLHTLKNLKCSKIGFINFSHGFADGKNKISVHGK